MKSMTLICVLLVTAFGCSKTRNVLVPGLAEPPSQKPEGEIPPIVNPGDGILQNDEVEGYALDDVLKLNQADVLNTVYISAANFVNAEDDVAGARQGTELGLNLLSNRAFIEKARPVDPKESIYAVDLRDFFGSQGIQFWRLIEDQAVIQIVSQTVRFKNLQFITQKRIPIMHAQIFLETAFKAQVYYAIKNVALSENAFWLAQGIDRQKQFDDRDQGIFLAGFQESLIAPDHNREVRRMEGNNGACWNTYDVDALQIIDQSNFFKFPFPPEARSPKTLIHNAGEILCRQANGLYVAALYNGAGVRQDLAPTTVVVNTRTSALGLDPSITLRDCAGCHSQFVLPMKDEMRRQIQDNPFNAQDKLLGQLFFKPQAELDKAIAEDNAEHAAALQGIGITAGGPDPVNVGVIDKMRDGMTAKELAAFLYISEGELLTGLAGSQNASAEVGQLLQGGTIGFIALQASIQTIITDLNLFRDIQ